MSTMYAAAGFLLLVSGSQLHGVFVAGIFFLIGSLVLPEVYNFKSATDMIYTAVGLALAGLILSIPLRRLMTTLAGFFAGGYLSLALPGVLAWTSYQFSWVIFVIVGLVSAAFTFISYSFGLIVLSSVTGAVLIAQNVRFFPTQPIVTFFLLFVFGIAVQLLLAQYVFPTLEEE